MSLSLKVKLPLCSCFRSACVFRALETSLPSQCNFPFLTSRQITWGSTRRRRRWGTRRTAALATGCPPTASRRWATSARTRRRTWSCNQIYYHPRVPISLIISIPCKIPDRSSYYQIDAYTRDSESHFWWRRRDPFYYSSLLSSLVAHRSYIYRGVGDWPSPARREWKWRRRTR